MKTKVQEQFDKVDHALFCVEGRWRGIKITTKLNQPVDEEAIAQLLFSVKVLQKQAKLYNKQLKEEQK